MNFVSRCGGVLSQFVNFTAPEKSRIVSIHIHFDKKSGKSGRRKRMHENKSR